MARVLRLPDHGRLLVCTDLQGCLRDYYKIVDWFMKTRAETGGDAHLLFTGDLVHGPRIPRDDWPDFLGEYYWDQSGELVEEFVRLKRRYPDHVHALLGNHEHGHIGGPHTAKFAADEVALLEYHLGPERSERLREVFNTFALVAVAPCGAVFTHGAPAAEVADVRDIEAIDVNHFDCDSPLDILGVPVLGPILWARSAPADRARAFVRALGGTIAIYGHDVIPDGFERVGDEQIVVSTSFGVYDSHKVYLELDLGARYETVHDLRVGREIRPLYPEKSIYFKDKGGK
ncbi:MAG: serine/threonine protein phosphatase [Deltaproteobacteria bacterium]|nr:MAG: serine/threonine protein phosphatase [Deltaproteobacteria bacterium]